MKQFIQGLIEHLRDNKDNFYSKEWEVDTERGFWEEEHFDFDALLAEIDTFCETFK